MEIKVRRTSLFGNVELSVEFITSVLGNPITDGNEQIGILTRYDKETDQFYLDIDDIYKEHLECNKICSMEVMHECSIDKSSREQSSLKCPYCRNERGVGSFEWLDILDDLNMFGKTVVNCPACHKMFIIREDEDGRPFIIGAKYK